MGNQFDLLGDAKGGVLIVSKISFAFPIGNLSFGKLSHQYGVTLVELLTVTSIIGIVLAIGLPNLSQWMSSQRLRAEAETLIKGLQLARSEAILTNLNVLFLLEGSNGGWVIRRSSGGCNFVPPEPDNLIVRRHLPSAGSAALTILPFSDAAAQTASPESTAFVFGPSGMQVCTNAAGIDSFRSLRLEVSGATDVRRIVTSAAGRTLLCDPDSKLSASDPRRCP